MKIAFCSSEVVPFAKTGGMADVCGTLPIALEKLKQDVVVVLPGYSVIDRKKFGLTKICSDISRGSIGKNIPVYFIEHDGYFGRSGIYGDKDGDYSDNLERFDFYCRRTLELFKELKLNIDLVHCHDWQSALITVYLKELYKNQPFYAKIKSILSLHNLAYQGVFAAGYYKRLNLGEEIYRRAFEFYGKVNLLKAGIIYSDVVATVSPQYAREIQTQEFGCGLEGVLHSRGESMIGILNGLDDNTWDPRRDRIIPHTYSAENWAPKAVNKTVLQKKFKLPAKSKIPVLGFVSRLSHQKGLDLLHEAMDQLMTLDIQMIFLGIGEEKYHQMLLTWARTYPQKIGINISFDEDLAHGVYAGADFFLMPSIFEPCGLSQMISLRYGTVPIVYRVGGLADTIIPFDQGGNGFVFTEYRAEEFFQEVKKAVLVYQKADVFAQIVEQAFKANFSWEDSARQYLGLYHQCLKN